MVSSLPIRQDLMKSMEQQNSISKKQKKNPLTKRGNYATMGLSSRAKGNVDVTDGGMRGERRGETPYFDFLREEEGIRFMDRSPPLKIVTDRSGRLPSNSCVVLKPNNNLYGLLEKPKGFEENTNGSIK